MNPVTNRIVGIYLALLMLLCSGCCKNIIDESRDQAVYSELVRWVDYEVIPQLVDCVDLNYAESPYFAFRLNEYLIKKSPLLKQRAITAGLAGEQIISGSGELVGYSIIGLGFIECGKFSGLVLFDENYRYKGVEFTNIDGRVVFSGGRVQTDTVAGKGILFDYVGNGKFLIRQNSPDKAK